MEKKFPFHGSTNFFQETLDSLSIHLAILNEQGVIVAVNDSWRHFGMTNQYEDSNWGVGRNYLGICQDAIGAQNEDARKAAEAIQQLLCGEKDSFQMEYPCHKNTEQRWFLLSLTRFNFAGQTWLVAAHKDISQGTVAEQGLQLRNRAMAAADEGITITDATQIGNPIIYANSGFLRITGYSLNQVLGRNCRFLQGPETDQQAIEIIRQALRTQTSCTVELLNYDVDEHPFWNKLSITPIKDGVGQTTHYVGIQSDITEKKQMEETLRQRTEELEELNTRLVNSEQALLRQNANKDKFFSIISHDLKSPFHSILGFAEILSGDLSDFTLEEIRLYGNHIHVGAQNLLNLLENLMQWTRLQSGRMGYQPEPLLLRERVEMVLSLLQGNLLAKKIHFDCSLDPEMLVYADRTHLSLLMQNLVSNAIKFTQEQGKIQVCANQQDDMIIICVEDNGVGIAPQRLSDLFQLETSFSTVGTANEKGTGLGLILCHELVRENSGQIWAESILGEGSRFYFTLPSSIQALTVLDEDFRLKQN
jgi:PAS domain S-box-containing protein